MDVTFIVAVSIFLVFIFLILAATVNYFTRTPESMLVLELRGKAKDFFNNLFGRGGIATNERVTTDLHRIPLLVEELNGTARTNEVVAVSAEFDDLCLRKASWNNTVRVYDHGFNEFPSRISYQEFCSSQLLNTSYVTFLVNISANEKKKIYIYSINSTGTTPPKHNTTLKGYWKFDETSGTLARDSSGWENNGTLFDGSTRCANGSCPTWAAGIFGNAVQLDGSNDYVNVSDSSSINLTSDRLTLAAWVKLNGTTGSSTIGSIVSKTAGSGSEQYEISYTTNSHGTPNRFRFDTRTSNGLSILYTNETFTETNVWYHVTGAYNSTHMIIYVNGLEKNATSQSGSVTGRVSDVGIGQSAATGNNFNGTIDEARIYNETLSASSISALAIRSNQISGVTIFPSETITAIDATKLQNLTSRNYAELKSALGDFDFRIEISEKR